SIVEMMAGRSIENLYPRTKRTAGEAALVVDAIAGARLPKRASLTLRRGEVLGVAGLLGAGRTELLRALFGLDDVRSGSIKVGAYVGPASPAARLRQGVGFVSEDRKAEGLATRLSIAENLTLSKISGVGPALVRAEDDAARTWLSRLAIKAAG